MDRIFDGRIDDPAYVMEVFERHVAEVRAAIPAARLLVFDVREGWGPLCAFLGDAVPDQPFPQVNEREAFRRKWRADSSSLIFRGR